MKQPHDQKDSNMLVYTDKTKEMVIYLGKKA